MKTATATVAGVAGALILGLVLGWAGRGLLTFNADTATDTVYQNWRLICPASSQKNSACQMSDDLMDAKSHQEIARLVIGKDKGKTEMGITLPLEVSLQSGVGVVLDSGAMHTYPYRTCTQIGCIAILPLDDKMIATMAAAKKGGVIYAGADGKATRIDFTMDGFPEARRAFKHNETRRTSWFWRMWS